MIWGKSTSWNFIVQWQICIIFCILDLFDIWLRKSDLLMDWFAVVHCRYLYIKHWKFFIMSNFNSERYVIIYWIKVFIKILISSNIYWQIKKMLSTYVYQECRVKLYILSTLLDNEWRIYSANKPYKVFIIGA